MRNRKNLSINQATYIFVEGETEEAYFKELQQRYNLGASKIIKILNGSGDYVDQAERKINNSHKGKPQNKILIFDTNHKSKNYMQTLLRKATSKGYEIGYSNTCFELWLLAHFEQVNQSLIKEKNLMVKLSNHISKGQYSKANLNQIARIVDLVDDGVNHSKIISNINVNNLDLGFQFTTVGKIVEKHFTNK